MDYKSIELTVPCAFNISERMDAQTPEKKAEILRIGEYVYFNGLEYFDRNKFNTEMDIVKKLLTDSQDPIIKIKDSIIETKNENIFKLEDRIRTLEKESLTALSLSGKLDSLLCKGNNIDNTTKGEFGENVVQKQIEYFYPEAYIEDVSANAKSGDLTVSIDTSKILVEVKNVQIVKNSEIVKFERDLEFNTGNGNCNCALFVSLKSETIPTKGSFKLTFHKDVYPVLYISNVYNHLDLVKYGINILKNIQTQMASMQNMNETDNEYLEFRDKTERMAKNIFSKAQESVKILNNMRHCLTMQETFVNDILKNVSLYNTEIQIENKENSLQKELVKEYILFYKTNKKMPKSSELKDYKRSVYKDDCTHTKLIELAKKMLTA
jgi:hypothetical protein